MSKLVQVKDVPDDVHRTLKSRAALQGQSLSEYLRAELETLATRPSPAELEALLASRHAPDSLGVSSAEEVRRARERAQ